MTMWERAAHSCSHIGSPSRQQPEYGYPIRCSHKHLAIRDCRSDEFVTVAELIAAVGGLVAVVDFG